MTPEPIHVTSENSNICPVCGNKNFLCCVYDAARDHHQPLICRVCWDNLTLPQKLRFARDAVTQYSQPDKLEANWQTAAKRIWAGWKPGDTT